MKSKKRHKPIVAYVGIKWSLTRCTYHDIKAFMSQDCLDGQGSAVL